MFLYVFSLFLCYIGIMFWRFMIAKIVISYFTCKYKVHFFLLFLFFCSAFANTLCEAD